jgi:ABC-type sugar transport system permease subunit
MDLVLDFGFMLSLPAVVIVSAVVFSILGYALFVSFNKVKLGQPPVGKLFIAYKYAYLGRSVYDDFLKSCQKTFSGCRPIKLCYGGPKVCLLSLLIEFPLLLLITALGIFWKGDVDN